MDLLTIFKMENLEEKAKQEVTDIKIDEPVVKLSLNAISVTNKLSGYRDPLDAEQISNPEKHRY